MFVSNRFQATCRHLFMFCGSILPTEISFCVCGFVVVFFRKPIFRKLLKLRFDGQRSLYLFFLPPYLSEFRFWKRRIAKNFLFAVLFVAGLLLQKTVFLHFNITNNRCQYPFLIFLQFFWSKNRQLAVATGQNNGQCAVFIVVSAAVF